MAFNHYAHKTANAISAFSLLLFVVVGLDLVLPRSLSQEPIERKWRETYVSKPKYGRRTTSKNSERVFLVTGNHEFPVDSRQSFGSSVGDTIQVYSSPMLGLVREVNLVKQGQVKAFKRKASLLGNFSFVPLALFFTAILGLINYRNQQQAINFGSGSLILILWMVKDI